MIPNSILTPLTRPGRRRPEADSRTASEVKFVVETAAEFGEFGDARAPSASSPLKALAEDVRRRALL
jgi:hypothetical protein